ncbi:Rieske (2Fe-2S) protein [Halovenus rubra]|uniref:Rieske (2Fe-2S) protein n=2 Tax=Halovenus rubra TaxID=869890 RepID=A0ACC7DZU2_9EURY|nr:Rieske (2Fe-2S) protein [Halovenus rubra]
MVSDSYVRVTDVESLESDGRQLVSPHGNAVVLFHHDDDVYAVDNRCPHMGFPLSKGSVEDGIVTCHWHHARFELSCGDTFDIWADDVQTYPTAIQDGDVYLDPDPERTVSPATHWRNRLVDGLAENIPLVMAKAVLNLDTHDEGFSTPLSTTVDFGINYRAAGWGRGLTTLGTMANLYDWVDHDQKRRAMYIGTQEVADNVSGSPARFDQYALDNEELTKQRLKSWFQENCEVRDSNGAERIIRTAAATLPRADIIEILVATATDHLYLNNSHTLDFINKACETLDHVGWEKAPDVLGATVEQLTEASRAEEQSSWRQPVDVATLVFDAHERLPDLVATGDTSTWSQPDEFVDRLLSDDPEAIIDHLCDAIADGATAPQLTDAVATAATRRVAQFATSNEFNDWDTVHHTFSYANAAHELARRTEATEAYRPAFDGAISVYLNRFLNEPAAPIPEPTQTERPPEEIRTELLNAFDRQGAVDEAGRLVTEHFVAGGTAKKLIQTLGEGLLREDPQFHTLQNVEGAVRRFQRADTERQKRLPLVGTARYMSAHFPTRRSSEQTFEIARRLHRGDQLHGSE